MSDYIGSPHDDQHTPAASTPPDTPRGRPLVQLLYTPPEAARLCRISPKALWLATSPRGSLACVRIGRSVRYALRDIEAWIESSRTSSQSKTEGAGV